MLWRSMDFNQNVIDLFAQLKLEELNLFLSTSRDYGCFKIANQHIIFDSFYIT